MTDATDTPGAELAPIDKAAAGKSGSPTYTGRDCNVAWAAWYDAGQEFYRVALVGPDRKRLKAEQPRGLHPWHIVHHKDRIPELCLGQWLNHYAGHTYSLSDDIVETHVAGAHGLLMRRRRQKARHRARRQRQNSDCYAIDEDGREYHV